MATANPNFNPSYGSNIENFNKDDPLQKALADAGQQWAAAKRAGDQAGMDAAKAAGNDLRTQMGNATYNSGTGVTTVGNNQPVANNGGNTGGSFMDSLRGSYDQQIESQRAQIEQARVQALADLERSFQQAVMAGQMSVNEANAAYAKQAEQINQQAYLDSQSTNLAASSRGIGNSQQLLGMMATDHANNQQLKNQNMSDRDTKILNIQERIRALTAQKDIDKDTINRMSSQEQIRSAADLNAQYLNQQFQVGWDDHKSARDYGNQLGLMGQQQRYALEQMAKAHGYDLSKMSQQQINDLQKMSLNQKFNLETLEKQYGYDMNKMAQSFRNQSALSDKEFNQKLSLLDKQIKQEQDDYEKARARELAKYDPATPEYQIVQGQLKQQSQQRIQEMMDKYQTEFKFVNATQNPYWDATFDPIKDKPEEKGFWSSAFDYTTPGVLKNLFESYIKPHFSNQKEMDEYERKLNAYNEMLQIMSK